MKITNITLSIMFSCISLTQALLAESHAELHPADSPGCLALLEAETNITPPELAMGLLDCVKSNEVKKAHDLFLLMMIRSVYDSKRVDDQSAGAAVDALRYEVLGQIDSGFSDRVTEFQNEIKQPYYDEICNILKNKGIPKYYPKYMVLHGLNAITGISGDGLKESFDEEAEWFNTVDQFLSCTNTDALGSENNTLYTTCNNLCDSGWWKTAGFFKVILEINTGAELNGKDSDYKRTPLHWAAVLGSPKTVEILLRAGSDVLAKDKNGKTPLDLANKNPTLADTTALEKLRHATREKMGNEN